MRKLQRILSRWFSLPILLLVGFFALAFAWQLAGTRAANGFTAILLALWFVCWMGAFLRLLKKRDQMRAARPTLPPQVIPPDPALEGTIYGLQPGTAYRVMQTFSDFYGGEFTRDERLHFKQRHFLPYHGGHTIEFAERTLYLQEDANREILGAFAQYIARAE